ncbi:MAG: hypothetical protein R3C44_07320 [Chloroflexota bacterium]
MATPDDDHIAGLVPVLERYQVGMLLTNGAPPGNDAAYIALLKRPLIRDAGCMLWSAVRLSALIRIPP